LIDLLINTFFLKQMQMYRFSIAWSRIIPDGGEVNMEGIAYYNNLINELIANGIEPAVTMYHWDLPQYLQDLGGWMSPLMIDHFEYYADTLYRNFGDRVTKWITFNEPFIFCIYGYGQGTHAPSMNITGVGEYLCGHNVLLSHATAYHLYQEKYAADQQGQVGISLHSDSYFSYEGGDTTLAEKAQQFHLGWFADPIFSDAGGYPEIMIQSIGAFSEAEGRSWSRLPEMTEEEKVFIQGTADFFGLNYYTGNYVTQKTEAYDHPSWYNDVNVNLIKDQSWKRGHSNWLFSTPTGFRNVMVWIKNRYNNPILMITENGWSDDGSSLQDDDRIQYVKEHLAAISKAINIDGCNVVNYNYWSIMDNFEWLVGYTERFGLFAVDMESEEKTRIAKKSTEFFKTLTAERSFVYLSNLP